MSLSANDRQSSSACRAAQVQTEASLGSWRGRYWLGIGDFFVCFAIFNELMMSCIL